MTYIPNRAAKVDWGVVRKIRHLYEEEGWTQGRLAREFGIGAAQIGRIVRYESWQEEKVEAPGKMEGSLSLVQKLLEQAQSERDQANQVESNLKELESKQ